ncbi:RNaseP protein p30 [Carabus blaptoides fortunei]
MENTQSFYDLCIQDKCYNSHDFLLTAKKLVEYGYRTVAINQTIDEEALETNKKKKKGDRETNEIVPVPITLKSEKSCPGLKILNRLTVTFAEKSTLYKVMQSEQVKKYHIFAVIPKSNEALQFVCDTVDADIISFDPSDSRTMKMNRKICNMLLERDVYFELMYFPAIQDATCRKNIINKAHLYHQYAKSKNVIITSGALNQLSLRGPYDVINLGLLFGLSEVQAKSAISSACNDLINRAVGRRMGKALIVAEPIVTLTSDDAAEEMEVDSDEPALKKSKGNQNDDTK